MNFNTEIFNINEKVEIKLHKIDEENTLDFNEMLETNLEQIDKTVE